MKRDAFQSPFKLHNAPYNLSLATQASSSTASVWSDAGSQHSDDSNTSASSTSDSYDSYCFSQPPLSSQSSVSSLGSACGPITAQDECSSKPQPKPCFAQQVLPQEQRMNPRRSISVNTRNGRPPALVRQAERKLSFVDNLVDSSAHIVEAIWPTSSVIARNEHGASTVLPLRTFIQETLRRSRTSYSTLQVALYYLILIKPHVPDHDFTMEQPDDCHASQALQCGRRMFLAALILASKYLQDRNYSSRAWSKISGLQTHEINQNERAFLQAVKWKLHITDEIYSRWSECVMKFRPPPPPSPGVSPRLYERQCEDFRAVISTLTPELDNLAALDSILPVQTPEAMPRESLFGERTCVFPYDGELTPGSRLSLGGGGGGAPAVMEPSPTAPHAFGRFPQPPALGLLPTPRLTPQSSGYSTPAVSAASYMLAKGSMGYAMAQASSTATSQFDGWPPSALPSPQTHLMRRSSLANSVSTASSPESMVSDSSRLSRSSSISSISSVNAPSAKLDVLARYRSAKLCSERSSLRPTFAPVPEDQQVECLVASPESFTGTVGDPYARTRREMAEAAWALHEMHTHGANKPAPAQEVVRAGAKRSRSASIENSLHDNVRGLLSGHAQAGESTWSDALLRAHAGFMGNALQVPARTNNLPGSRKRLCCSTEAVEPFSIPSMHPAVGGVGGPGMWSGILH